MKMEKWKGTDVLCDFTKMPTKQEPIARAPTLVCIKYLPMIIDGLRTIAALIGHNEIPEGNACLATRGLGHN